MIEAIHGHIINMNMMPQNDAIVIDAGACKGLFSVGIQAHIGPTGRIFLFEPCLTLYDYIQTHLPEFDLSQQALVGEKQPKTMKFMEYTNKLGWGSLLIDHEGAATKIEYDVPTITLAEIIQAYKLPHIDYLKMDIEGMEEDVVATMTGAIAHKIRQLSYEIHDRAVKEQHVKMLTVLGFDAVAVIGEIYAYRTDVK